MISCAGEVDHLLMVLSTAHLRLTSLSSHLRRIYSLLRTTLRGTPSMTRQTAFSINVYIALTAAAYHLPGVQMVSQ
ncbi:hypothetical protein BDR05DRAFT_965815 [Suillus weaverae]|nr:hypothetical protein BDR05DRAFT_965815 [Suillus weaverae]